MTQSVPPAWHSDPSKRHQQRYWDGEAWTEHVSTNGVQDVDVHGSEMSNRGEVETHSGIIDGELFKSPTTENIQNQVTRAMAGDETIPQAMSAIPEFSATPTHPTGDKNIFTENILVVNQKAKLLELTAEFRIFDSSGVQIGVVRQVGQSKAKKVARALLNVDALMTHTLEIADMNGNVLMSITKPRALLKPKVIVSRGDGTVLGELQIKLRIGKAQIKLMVGDAHVGMIYAENFRAWNFRIVDGNERQIASITKTWEGFAKMAFTTADNYVVQIHEPLVDPMHSLVLASSLAVDLILKQNDNGIL